MAINQISFIKSYYNSKKYIKLLIDGILNKTYQNIKHFLFSITSIMQINLRRFFQYFFAKVYMHQKFLVK